MGTSPHSPAPTFLLRWDQSTCDRAQMARFLTANPDKANAWVAAQNHDPSLRWSGGTSLTASQIPAYLNELTPIRLLADTRVTNNGYVNGAPTPHQSVLQAGTAVLVDQYGVPRARCACGNPLQPPVALSSPVFRDNPWPGYGTTVVVNQSATIVSDFTLINIYNVSTYTRPAGTDGTRDTPTTLNRWVTAADTPSARYFLAAAAGADGRLYAFGGLQQYAPSGPSSIRVTDTVESYDPAETYGARKRPCQPRDAAWRRSVRATATSMSSAAKASPT